MNAAVFFNQIVIKGFDRHRHFAVENKLGTSFECFLTLAMLEHVTPGFHDHVDFGQRDPPGGLDLDLGGLSFDNSGVIRLNPDQWQEAVVKMQVVIHNANRHFLTPVPGFHRIRNRVSVTPTDSGPNLPRFLGRFVVDGWNFKIPLGSPIELDGCWQRRLREVIAYRPDINCDRTVDRIRR